MFPNFCMICILTSGLKSASTFKAALIKKKHTHTNEDIRATEYEMMEQNFCIYFLIFTFSLNPQFFECSKIFECVIDPMLLVAHVCPDAPVRPHHLLCSKLARTFDTLIMKIDAAMRSCCCWKNYMRWPHSNINSFKLQANNIVIGGCSRKVGVITGRELLSVSWKYIQTLIVTTVNSYSCGPYYVWHVDRYDQRKLWNI